MQPESAQFIGTAQAALGGDRVGQRPARQGRDRGGHVHRAGEQGQQYAGHAGFPPLVRRQVEPAQPEPEQQPAPHAGRPQGQPLGAVDLDHRDTEQQVDGRGDGAEQDGRANARIVELDQSVEEALPWPEPDPGAELALEQDLPDPVRPALLLVEVVGPRLRTVADGQDVRRVDPAPGLAGDGVDRALHPHARQVVLDDRVLVSADLAPRRRPVQVIRADEQRRAEAVAAPFHDPAEQVLLDGRAMGNPVLVHIPVHLGSDDERNIGVAEIADRPLQEAGQRHVIGIHLGDDVVVPLVVVAPGVVVAGFRPGPVRAPRLVVSREALTAEVVDPQALRHGPHRGVIALVENPDVYLAAVADLAHGPQSPLHHVDRLLRRHDRGQQRDAQAARRGLGHWVLHGRGEEPDGGVLHQADRLHADDHAERHAGSAEAPAPEADHPGAGDVHRQQQPADEDQGRQGVEPGQQGQRDTLPGRSHRAEADSRVSREIQLAREVRAPGVIPADRCTPSLPPGGTASRHRCVPVPQSRLTGAGPVVPGHAGRCTFSQLRTVPLSCIEMLIRPGHDDNGRAGGDVR